jgi:Na+-translocating ferredoxin:NAD+ oxidoreductase RnfC subunit
MRSRSGLSLLLGNGNGRQSTHATLTPSVLGARSTSMHEDSAETSRLFYCARCGSLVRLCRSCNRGQRYCSKACSQAARIELLRETRRRYQQTARGRELHAARQQAYRRRRTSTRPVARSETGHTVRRAVPDGIRPVCARCGRRTSEFVLFATMIRHAWSCYG